MSVLFGVATSAPQVMAQSSTGKPVRIVVPYPAGGGIDAMARAFQDEVAKRLGQPVIVENRPGAGGVVGAKAVVASDPDGTMLLLGIASNIHSIFNKNFVDASKELAAVSNVGYGPLIFFVTSGLPVRNLQELIAYAKAQPPNKLNFAVVAPIAELTMHMVRSKTGITFTPIQYKGAAPLVNAMLSGEADMAFNTWLGLGQHVQAGKAKALFYAAPKRNDLFPEVPLARDFGLQELEGSATNIGLWAARATPNDVIQRLSRAAAASVQLPEITERIRKIGFEVIGSTPEDQLRAFDIEIKFFSDAARLANYVPQ